MKELTSNMADGRVVLEIDISDNFITIEHKTTNTPYRQVLAVTLSDDKELNKAIIEVAISNYFSAYLDKYL
jgi:Lon protease-like protein